MDFQWCSPFHWINEPPHPFHDRRSAALLRTSFGPQAVPSPGEVWHLFMEKNIGSWWKAMEIWWNMVENHGNCKTLGGNIGKWWFTPVDGMAGLHNFHGNEGWGGPIYIYTQQKDFKIKQLHLTLPAKPMPLPCVAAAALCQAPECFGCLPAGCANRWSKDERWYDNI